VFSAERNKGGKISTKKSRKFIEKSFEIGYYVTVDFNERYCKEGHA